MANRFFTPNQQFADGTGLPYAGYYLGFYASGTSTPLATYSDRALSSPNANPVQLDSAGRSGNIFLQNLAYKVVLSSDLAQTAPVWTADPVYSSDFSTTASFQSGNGSPNGSVAGSAGSTTIPASSYWDATNNILYVCTQTGTSSTAVWTAVNATTAASVIPAPQGYLTPVSGTPVISSDSTGATQVYYTPYVGNLIPIYNGTSFVPTIFSELSIALVAQHASNTIYDLFVFNNSGVLTLVSGPAWSNSSAGTGARGSGAGTTQLTRINGIWVNNVSMTGRNGSTTYSIPANQATYVGSLFVDSSVGQVTCHRSFGQSRKWGIWNAYNRAIIELQGGTASASWVNAPTTWRQSAGDSANYVMGFCGLSEEEIDISFVQFIQNSAPAGTTSTANIGIGINSTTSPTGEIGWSGLGWTGTGSITHYATAKAAAVLSPAIGINQINMIEQAPSGTTNNQYNGTSSNMLIVARWRG